MRIAYGGAQPNISSAKLLDLPCFLPSLAEQKRIVKKIEELFTNIDIATKNLQQAQDNLIKFRNSIIRENFKNYKVYKKCLLGDALVYEQPTKYIISSTEYSDSFSTPVLTPGKSFIKGYTNDKMGIFNKGLPVIIFDDFTTAIQFVNFPFKVKSSAMKILHINNKIANIKFLFYYLSQITKIKGTHKRYWISEYANKIIELPSLSEQEHIVAKIEEEFRKADILQQKIESALESAKQLKQSILKKAFEGKLVPQDSNDEPASILLEKIKKGKSKNNKTKRKIQ